MSLSVLTGNPDMVSLGPGVLFVAPLGTAEPTTPQAVTAASAWREVGWTDDGTQFSQDTTTEGIFVEEEFYPVKYSVTEVTPKVAFAMKMGNRKNLMLALNLGANGTNNGTIVEPPTPGNELRVMIVLVSPSDGLYIFRRCYQSGSVNINFQKAPDAMLIPVEFTLEKPTGAAPYACYPTAAGLL